MVSNFRTEDIRLFKVVSCSANPTTTNFKTMNLAFSRILQTNQIDFDCNVCLETSQFRNQLLNLVKKMNINLSTCRHRLFIIIQLNSMQYHILRRIIYPGIYLKRYFTNSAEFTEKSFDIFFSGPMVEPSHVHTCRHFRHLKAIEFQIFGLEIIRLHEKTASVANGRDYRVTTELT